MPSKQKDAKTKKIIIPPLLIAVLVVVFSVVVLIFGIGVSCWTWAHFGFFGNSTQYWYIFLLALLLFSLYLLMSICTLVLGVSGIIWFILYIARVSQRMQLTLLRLAIFSNLITIVGYIVLVILGVILFVLGLISNRGLYTGWIGSVFGLLIFICVVVILFLANSKCTEHAPQVVVSV
mmetsp:Transcript_11133/g.41598  ORF Transcript_11133/g.41598 Transcript_11133/m.41598 type:complete len:178 (-) Transcript_11133:250-783(-)